MLSGNQGFSLFKPKNESFTLNKAMKIGRNCFLNAVKGSVISVHYYTLLASAKTVETQTCENALASYPKMSVLEATFIRDTGIYCYWVGGAVCGIAIPLSYFAAKKSYLAIFDKRLIEKQTEKNLLELKESIFNSLSFAALAGELPVPNFLRYSFMTIAGAPIALYGLKKTIPDYPTVACWPTIDAALTGKEKILATLLELLAKQNCGPALSAFAYYFIDNFYDAGHENDFAYTNQFQLGSLSFGVLVAVISFLNETAYQRTNQLSDVLTNFYLIAMPLISILMCLDQNLENVDDYYENGAIWVSAITFFAMATSLLNNFYTNSLIENSEEMNDEFNNEFNNNNFESDEESQVEEVLTVNESEFEYTDIASYSIQKRSSKELSTSNEKPQNKKILILGDKLTQFSSPISTVKSKTSSTSSSASSSASLETSSDFNPNSIRRSYFK